jgi:hypothetical protein
MSVHALELASMPIFRPSHIERRPPGVLRTATPTERVRLVVALSETGCTLRCIVVSLDVRGGRCGGRATYSLWLGTRRDNCQYSQANLLLLQGGIPGDAVVSIEGGVSRVVVIFSKTGLG